MNVERMPPDATRSVWARSMEKHIFEGRIAEEERRFLDFIKSRLFTDTPQSLRDARQEMTDLASKLDRFRETEPARNRGALAGTPKTYSPGESSSSEVVETIELWCRRTAEVLKHETYPDTEHRFKPVTTEVIAETVEHYLLTQMRDVANANETYGLSFFMMMPDIMNITPQGRMTRDYRHTLTHMSLSKRAVFHHLANLDKMGEMREGLPYQEYIVPLYIIPQRMIDASNNLVALTQEDTFKKLVRTIAKAPSIPIKQKDWYLADALHLLTQVNNPDMRKELAEEAVKQITAGRSKLALKDLEERTAYDYTTYRLLIPDPSGNANMTAVNPSYPGVNELDDDRRRILRDVAVEMRGNRGHNDIIVDPLIRTLRTHQNNIHDLRHLSYLYSTYVTHTKDNYPAALDGMESEPLEVKLEFLQLLTKTHDITGQIMPEKAQELKTRITAETKEARKLEIIQNENQALSRHVDDLLKD